MKRSRQSGRITRRDVLKLGAASAGLLAGAPMILAKSAWSQTVEEELVFASNGGAYQKLIETQLFPEFSRQTGVRKLTYVAGQGPESLAKMRVQKANPAIDVVWLAGAVGYQASDEGLLEEIDRAALPNLSAIPPELLTEKMFVPITVTFMGLVHNREVFQKNGFAAPTSWWDLWDPRFKGHVGSFSSNSTGQVAVLVQIAKMLTGDYKNLDPAIQKFKELKPNVVDFFTSPGGLDKAIQEREVWITLHAVQGGIQLARSGQPIEFTHPKEGVVGYGVGAGIVKNAPHPRAARAWINYLLSAEAQAKLAAGGYGPVNPDAKIPPDLTKFYVDPKKIFVPDWRYLTQQLPGIVDRWSRIVER